MIPERYKKQGFNKVGQKKQSTRPGKKWMVLAKKGDSYKIVHGGDDSMQDYTQHHSEQRRKNFWNRMGGKNSSKATDPFSPLYWHKRFGTWAIGGKNTAEGQQTAFNQYMLGMLKDSEEGEDFNPYVINPDSTFEVSDEVKNKLKKNRQEISPIRKYGENLQYDIKTGTGQYDFSPEFEGFNALAQITTGIANMSNDAKARRYENNQYLKALTPQPKYNYNEAGLNNIPLYGNGGKTKHNAIEQAFIDAYNNYNNRVFPKETLETRQKAYRTINPSDYTDLRNYGRWVADEQRDEFYDPRSEEAFKFYLGLNRPEELQYLKKSKYKPTINATDQNYYSLDSDLEQDIFNSYKDKVKLNETLQTNEAEFQTPLSGKGAAGVLGRFGVSRGHDENGDYLSYYDKYDLKDFAQSRTKGMPYSIYNRIYYPKKQEGGKVVNPNNPVKLKNVNIVYKRPVAKSTFNPYANVNRVSSSDGTRVFRLNPEQAENAKKAAAIRNEKIVKEYLQNQQSFIGPDNRTKAEIDKGIALKKEYDRIQAMQNSDLAKTFASFTPGNNIEAGVMGAETFANLNPIISGPILATSRLAPAIMHPTNNAYWGSGRSNLENGLGVLGAIGDITMISPYLKIPLAGIKNPFKNKNFKSEINWANWNKEIPENVPLMQEYNAIEQTTKANGTWMKNFDGSKFKGTPEQFVQQNSENFKKAYKKGFNTGYRGQRIPTDIMDGGKYPSGITFLGDKDQAMTYGETWKKSHSGKIYQPGMVDPKEPALYELIYPNSNNKKIITHSNVRDWRELIDNEVASQMDEYLLELRGKSKKGEQFITTDDVANFVDKNNLDYAYLPKIRDYGRKPNRRFFNVFPGKSVGNTVVVNSKPGNYLKSRWYNNGMFDMTNPNIYKAVIPTMLGLGALNQKQEGGEVEKTEPVVNEVDPETYTKNQYERSKDFHRKWMTSAMYNKMLKASDPANAEKINKIRFDNLNSTRFVYEPIQPEDKVNTGGDSDSEGVVNIYPHGYNDNVSLLGTHEMSHSIDRPSVLFSGSEPDRVIPYEDVYRIDDYANVNRYNPKSLEDELYLKEFLDRYDYIATPTETRARLNAIRDSADRNKIYDPFTQKVNKKIFKKLTNFKFEKNPNWSPMDDLKSVYTDKQIINLLNTVSKKTNTDTNPQMMDDSNDWEIIG